MKKMFISTLILLSMALGDTHLASAFQFPTLNFQSESRITDLQVQQNFPIVNFSTVASIAKKTSSTY